MPKKNRKKKPSAPVLPFTAANEPVTLPCTTALQGSWRLYCFTAAAKLLWERLSVNRFDPDKQTGYQRAFSQSRITAIAKFFESGKAIPESIVVSLDNSCRYRESDATIELPAGPDVGWVIDGQHRLIGAATAKVDVQLVVVAFIDLSVENQIEQFVTINREQKGVPSSLYYQLLKKLPGVKSHNEQAQERAADLASLLHQEEGSPFQDRIARIASPKQGQISVTNFVRKVAPLVHPQKGRLGMYTPEEQKGAIANYYDAFAQVFAKDFSGSETIFFQTLGFGGLMNAFSFIFDTTLQRRKQFKVADVAEVLNRIDDFDFESKRNYGTGSAAEITLGNDIASSLRERFAGEDDGGGKLVL